MGEDERCIFSCKMQWGFAPTAKHRLQSRLHQKRHGEWSQTNPTAEKKAVESGSCRARASRRLGCDAENDPLRSHRPQRLADVLHVTISPSSSMYFHPRGLAG